MASMPIQQAITALAMNLAEVIVARDTEAARADRLEQENGMLRQAVEELDAALTELRSEGEGDEATQ